MLLTESKMKNKISFLTVVFLSIFMTSCLNNKPANDTRSIVMWEMEDAYVAPFIDEIITNFKKDYFKKHGIELNFTRAHYQTEDLRQQFQAASLAGVPPDIIISPSDTAGIYAISGFILPLDKVFDFNLYNKPVVEAITLDNKIWGIPISNGNHLMLMFNKKFIKEAPKTTDELFKFCDNNLKKYNLDYCLAFDGGEPFWLMPWLGGFGGWPLDNNKPTLNTPEMKRTLQFYHDLKFKYKYIPPECDYNCMDSLFKEGKVPFIINGDWAISSYSEQFKENFGIGLIPEISETHRYPTPMISGRYFLLSSPISSNTEKFEIVKEFVKFYTNKENQIKQFKELKRLPALKEASMSKEVLSDPIAKVSMEQILKGKPMPMAYEMRAVWDTVRNYQGLVMTNKMSIDEATFKMQKEVERKIKEMDR
ncbi:MAG: extracellular solute-binding protein [Elusimicrobiales bacterium]|jgi:arabinogalactan oligomer/maltooligosaccharide transport system substrate-binding protein|nr:extracellular solute-binding protein [Elusimicrobiales bacterium]